MKFLIKKLFLIHIIFSISFLIWTFYRSEIYWDGKIRNYYFIYYIISLILIGAINKELTVDSSTEAITSKSFLTNKS